MNLVFLYDSQIQVVDHDGATLPARANRCNHSDTALPLTPYLDLARAAGVTGPCKALLGVSLSYDLTLARPPRIFCDEEA